MSDRVDVIVAGGGIVGAATFFELASRGFEVTLIERNVVASGATAWSGGVVRIMHDDPVSADRAVYGWRWYRSLRARGVDVPFHADRLPLLPASPSAARSRAPRRTACGATCRSPGSTPSRSSAASATCSPTRAAARHGSPSRAGSTRATSPARSCARACEHGGRLVEGVELLDVDRSDGIVAETNIGELRARAIVLATGVRTPGLLDALGIEHDLFNRDIQVDVRAPLDGPRDQPAFIDDVYDLNGRPDPASDAVLIGFPTGLDSVSLEQRADPPGAFASGSSPRGASASPGSTARSRAAVAGTPSATRPTRLRV